MNLFRKLFGKKKVKVDMKAVSEKANTPGDPLDIFSRISTQGWQTEEDLKERIRKSFKKVSDFPLAIPNAQYDKEGGALILDGRLMDSAMDEIDVGGTVYDSETAQSVPYNIASWFLSQGFIGYQSCALIAQHWLVDKACSQSVSDSVRNGWTFKPDDGSKMSQQDKKRIEDFDVKTQISFNLREYGRFANVFGIRVMIFVVDSEDPDYYAKPFNPDGITEGSYKGMSQIDPYWMTPQLTNESMSNPAAMGFYEPDYWIINGKKYHKSHLCIARGPQPADVLKPTYYFGGIPLVQRIYERVYAAERTANEAPLLAMNKRTTIFHTDLDKVAANEQGFVQKLLLWAKYRDNHAVKVAGQEEEFEQFDTSLADFDNVIMNQYQLVAAIAKTPSTKILGTSPKGFNATGEFETVSYHEELESIRDDWMTPVVERHYLYVAKSLGLSYGLNFDWEPVDTMSSDKQSEINSKRIQDAGTMIDKGMASPEEARVKISNDKNSGWNNLSLEEDASPEIGATPENIALLEKAGAAETLANNGESKLSSPVQKPSDSLMDEENSSLNPDLLKAMGAMRLRLEKFIDENAPTDDSHIPSDSNPMRTVKGIRDVKPTVSSIVDVSPRMAVEDMPKVRLCGVTLAIENPRGSVRKGNSLSGSWSNTMPNHYGFIKGTEGADGEDIDAFLGPNPQSKNIFIINQNDINSGDFDEHKVMFGFDDAQSAKEGYLAAYSKDWTGFGSMSQVSPEELASWLSKGRAITPYIAANNGEEPEAL